MSLASFQRQRRMLAAKKAKQEEKAQEETENAADGQNEGQKDGGEQQPSDDGQENAVQGPKPLSPDDVDGMDIEKVKELLDQMNVKYVHNTGDDKLREKLKDAVNG